jgi:hypothetical protein
MNSSIARAVIRIALTVLVIGLVSAFVATAQRATMLRAELKEAGCRTRPDEEEVPA